MFREMRRKGQLLSDEEAVGILKARTSGVLGVFGDDDYPYTVPLSYIYKDGRLYFHCAVEGHKLDGIKRNDKVTFCVVDKDDVQYEACTTHFRSVSIFGRARILTDEGEIREALEGIAKKYAPDHPAVGQAKIAGSAGRICLIEVRIEHMTGKASAALIDKK
jgi:uncharacterized protein